MMLRFWKICSSIMYLIRITSNYLITFRYKYIYIYHLGETNELQLSRTSSFGSDADLKRQTQNSARIIYDRRDTNSLDNITRPLYQHPPAHTACCQQHRSVVKFNKKKFFFLLILLARFRLNINPLSY